MRRSEEVELRHSGGQLYDDEGWAGAFESACGAMERLGLTGGMVN